MAIGSRNTASADAAWTATREAMTAHPDIALDPERWAAALASALDAGGGAAVDMSALRIADLWLATALVDGDAQAVRVFESSLMPQVDRALRRFGLSDDEHAELRQRVRIRLLVAEGSDARPRIATYSGRGRLAAWVRTVSARLALNLRRDRRDHEELDDIPAFALPSSPAVSTLRIEERSLFVEALKQAFRRLEPADRALLRLRYAQNMALASLARAYGVHESTMSRRLTAVRRTMAGEFHEVATEALGGGASVDVMGLVQSRVESSLASLLASREPD